jgi:alpha-D-ribose 1-methylphosphonate 5-triphosphate synthase subunit PhnL
MTRRLTLDGCTKTFVLHNQGGLRLPVLRDVALSVDAGECVALDGASGSGKSTLIKCIYGNYRVDTGSISVHEDDAVTDLATATPRQVLGVRSRFVAYVSQFLRAVPRVAAIDVVAEPLLDAARGDGGAVTAARQAAERLLLRLRVPMRMWSIPPATFSGGEQQRINLARGLIRASPLLLLDEPTSALDAENRRTVVALINEYREAGAAIVGVFHDRSVRDAVATRVVDMGRFA